MHNVAKPELKSIIRKFKGKKILVIGDLMLDEYIWGGVSRISPEAPIPVVEVNREESKPGGAANVILNLVALGAGVYTAGVVGADTNAYKLLSYLKKNKVNTEAVMVDKKRPTTVKTRVIAHQQQIVRIDKEKKIPVSRKYIDGIIRKIEKLINNVNAVVFSDYNKGIITKELVNEVIQRAEGKIITVDPKPKNIKLFKNITLISPNKKEVAEATGMAVEKEKDIVRAAKVLKKMVDSEAVLITRGEEGMSLFEKGTVHNIPTVAKEVYDVTGAGDTVISVMTLALTAGASFKEAAVLSNIAAGLSVAEMGVAVVTPALFYGALNAK